MLVAIATKVFVAQFEQGQRTFMAYRIKGSYSQFSMKHKIFEHHTESENEADEIDSTVSF